MSRLSIFRSRFFWKIYSTFAALFLGESDVLSDSDSEAREKAGEVRDTSLRVPPGVEGTVINVRIFSRKGLGKDERSKIIEDEEIKSALARGDNYGTWVDEGIVRLEDLPAREHIVYPHSSVIRRQRAFGYTAAKLGGPINVKTRCHCVCVNDYDTNISIIFYKNKKRPDFSGLVEKDIYLNTRRWKNL